MRSAIIYGFLVYFGMASAFAGPPDALITDPSPQAFNAYWYPNRAKLSRFDLRQARYGAYHKGDAVMVFVTEALNRHTQIKADQPGLQDIPVLKLNAVRKFYTGVYPYATMTSLFSPVDAAAQSGLRNSARRGTDGQILLQYELDLPSAHRRLVIWFEQAFPHRIEAWEEHGRSSSGKMMVTQARRTHLIMLDYWNHHTNRDREIPPRLGLQADG